MFRRGMLPADVHGRLFLHSMPGCFETLEECWGGLRAAGVQTIVNLKRYDLFFLCDTDIPYAETWNRSGDQKRKWFQNQIVGDLAERHVPYFTVRGTLDERVAQVDAVLGQYRKFGNVLDVRLDSCRGA